MQDVVFESTRTMTADAFAQWIERRDRSDSNHYELLHGRIVMTPPAGYPHGEIESKLQVIVAAAVRGRAWGRVFGSSQGYEMPDRRRSRESSYASFPTWSSRSFRLPPRHATGGRKRESTKRAAFENTG